MKTVQPIRDLDKLEKFKLIAKKRSYRDYLLVLTGLNTGLRISDILPLRVRDVKNKEYIDLVEKKTGKNKKIKINPTLKDAYWEYTGNMHDEEYLFPSKKVKYSHIRRIMAYYIINSSARLAGIEQEIGTHTLRKTYGYHFYRRTKDVVLLQKVFNHSAPSVTLRYIGIEQDQIDQAYDSFSL